MSKVRRSSVANQKASVEDDLDTILRKLRNHEEEAINLVKYLERDSYNRDIHNLEFCKSYTIKLIQDYCEDSEDNKKGILKAEDKCELMLAACGLLSTIKFEGSKQPTRIKQYYDYAKKYNSLLAPGWSDTSVDSNTRKILTGITVELVTKLEEKRNKNGGNLNLISQVPKTLCLPSLRSDSTAEYSTQKTAICLLEWSKHMISAIEEKHKLLQTLSQMVIALALVVFVILFALQQFSEDAPPVKIPPEDYGEVGQFAHDIEETSGEVDSSNGSVSNILVSSAKGEKK